MYKKKKTKVSTALQKGDSAKEIAPRDEREALLIQNIFLHDTIKEAGLAAGYAPMTVNSGYFYKKIHSEDFQLKLLHYMKSHVVSSLPKALKIEDKAIDYLLTKEGEELVKDLSKLRHTLKERKMIAGLLRPEDTREKSLTINIEAAQKMMIRAGEERRKTLEMGQQGKAKSKQEKNKDN